MRTAHCNRETVRSITFICNKNSFDNANAINRKIAGLMAKRVRFLSDFTWSKSVGWAKEWNRREKLEEKNDAEDVNYHKCNYNFIVNNVTETRQLL